MLCHCSKSSLRFLIILGKTVLGLSFALVWSFEEFLFLAVTFCGRKVLANSFLVWGRFSILVLMHENTCKYVLLSYFLQIHIFRCWRSRFWLPRRLVFCMSLLVKSSLLTFEILFPALFYRHLNFLVGSNMELVAHTICMYPIRLSSVNVNNFAHEIIIPHCASRNILIKVSYQLN